MIDSQTLLFARNVAFINDNKNPFKWVTIYYSFPTHQGRVFFWKVDDQRQNQGTMEGMEGTSSMSFGRAVSQMVPSQLVRGNEIL
jgi:hypothetical protein